MDEMKAGPELDNSPRRGGSDLVRRYKTMNLIYLHLRDNMQTARAVRSGRSLRRRYAPNAFGSASENHLCTSNIPVEDATATTSVNPFFETLLLNDSALGTNLRSAGRINRHRMTTSVFSFVRQLVLENSPSSIHYAASKPSARHALDVQVLKRNQIKFIHQPVGELVVKVFSLCGDSLVNPSNTSNRLAPVATPADTSRKLPLCSRQLRRRRSGPSWISNLLAGAQRGKGVQANIHANHRRDNSFFGFFFPIINHHLGKPSGGSTNDTKHPLLPFNVLLLATAFDRSKLRNNHAIPANVLAGSLELDGIVATGRFESRVSGFFSVLHTMKERFESLVQAAGSIFCEIKRDFSQRRHRPSPLSNHRRLIVEVERFASSLVSLLPHFQTAVVKTAAFTKPTGERFRLNGRGVELDFNRSKHSEIIPSKAGEEKNHG